MMQTFLCPNEPCFAGFQIIPQNAREPSQGGVKPPLEDKLDRHDEAILDRHLDRQNNASIRDVCMGIISIYRYILLFFVCFWAVLCLVFS